MQDRRRPIGPRRWLLLSALTMLLGLAGSLAQAMPVKWRSANFKYAVDGKPVREVLRDFGASQGMVVAVAPDVEGSVAGKFDLTPKQFIDLMALSYGFVYYYNGAVLHISASQGMRSTLIRLNYARIQQLRDTLERMNVAEARFPIVYDEAANTAMVAGPQEYVDVIREIAVQLEKRTQTGGRSVTRVFPLRFAWAGDRRTGSSSGSDTDTVPGLATLLQSLYGRTSDLSRTDRDRSGVNSPLRAERTLSSRVAPALGAAQSERPLDTTTLSLRRALNLDMPRPGSGTAAAVNGAGNPAGSTSFAATTLPPPSSDPDGSGADDDQLPVILPDVAGNSILVRDLPERMPAYQALIASLDVQPRMIEIAVQILDVSENALSEIGVDWSLRGDHLSGRTGNGARGALDTLGGAAVGAATPAGGVLTAVLGHSGQALLARIAALQRTGQARISSQPKVATLNNVPAVMSSEKTFYVKVAGYQTAALYNVSAGLDMKVTPMATLGPDGYRIRLDVQVRDGQISTTETVSDLPTVVRSQLGTQAFVRQDESLLLAGYAVEQNNDRTSGVPVLSDLPVIGGLFRQKTTDRTRTDRLFLVTPRVLD